MSEDKYANSGFLYPREAKGKGPNASGNVKIGRDLLRWMFEEAKAGNEVELDIAGWEKTSKKSGEPYISILLNKPWKKTRSDAPVRKSGMFTAKKAADDEEAPF